MIKKQYFVFVMLFFILQSFSFGSGPLTIDDCIALARENNLELIQARITIEQAQAGLLGAYSSYYPNADLSSSAGYRNGGEKSYSTSIGVRYTIFQGGYIRAGTRLATARVKAAGENSRLIENRIILTVKEVLFEILQKQEQVSLIEDIFGRRKEDHILIKLRYESGRESSPAVKEAEANLLQAEYDKMQAENELILAKMKLNLLLDKPKKDNIQVIHVDKDTEFPTPENMLDEAKTERPEIRTEQANQEAFEAQVNQAKSNYFPTVSLTSSYGWQGSAFLEQQRGWSAGISLSLPVFSGFKRKAQVEEAALSLKEQQVKLKDLENSIEEEIEQAYSDLKLAEKNQEVSNKTLEAAREMYNLTRLQYEQGLTSYFFLQQKESALTRAEYDHINVLYNLRTARARLENALGRNS